MGPTILSHGHANCTTNVQDRKDGKKVMENTSHTRSEMDPEGVNSFHPNISMEYGPLGFWGLPMLPKDRFKKPPSHGAFETTPTLGQL